MPKTTAPGGSFPNRQPLKRRPLKGEVVVAPSDNESLKRIQAALDAKKAAKERQATNAAKNRKTPLDASLTRPMEAMQIGDPVPIVFCRRRTGGTGGVMVRPRATECRFANTAATIEAAYHCVLGIGYIYPIQERDVRNGPNRQGSYSQNYGLRAGAWRPERLVTTQASYTVPEFPQSLGGGGDYNGCTTIEFRNTYNPATQLDSWKLHWSCFVRNGMQIDRGRVFDSVVGASDNICDLYIWAQINAGLMTEEDIDMTAMLKAAKFIEANQLFCNAEFTKGSSLPDFLTSTLPMFLLRETSVAGKFALRPLVPTNDDGTIKTTQIEPDWIFSADSIAPGSYSEKWAPASSRRLVQLNVLWRQQTSDTEMPIMRDLQVMADGVTNPIVETFDLSSVATSEGHAALAGGYRQASRALGQGTATVRLLAGNQTGLLQAGMVVQIALDVNTNLEFPDRIQDFWIVDSIRFEPDGSESLALSHFPVDSSGRSLVALHVVAARSGAPGFLLPYPDIGADDVPGRENSTAEPLTITSGTPFTRGGSGGTSRFNQTRPPAPPPNQPPYNPPGKGGASVSGSSMGDAGGPPTKEGKPSVPLQRRSVVGVPIGPGGALPADPSECQFGVYQIRTEYGGGLIASGGGSAVGGILVTIEPVTAEHITSFPFTYTPYGTPVTIIVDRYEVRVQEQIPNAPRTFFVDDVVGPGINNPFKLEVLDWRCKLRTGGPGPVRKPTDPPI